MHTKFRMKKVLLAGLVGLLVIAGVGWYYVGWLGRGVVVVDFRSGGLKLAMGSWKSGEKLLDAIGYGSLNPRPLIMVEVVGRRPVRDEVVIYQVLDPQKPEVLSMGCKTVDQEGRLWKMKLYVQADDYWAVLGGGLGEERLSRGIGYCLMKMINSSQTRIEDETMTKKMLEVLSMTGNIFKI